MKPKGDRGHRHEKKKKRARPVGEIVRDSHWGDKRHKCIWHCMSSEAKSKAYSIQEEASGAISSEHDFDHSRCVKENRASERLMQQTIARGSQVDTCSRLSEDLDRF